MSKIAERVRCPYCRQGSGETCVTRNGKVRQHDHNQRWDQWKREYRSREMIYRLREDDPRMNLNKDDLLLCVAYPYDSKVTVLRRLTDGFDPECNQYHNGVEFVAFADEYEAAL